ncbi:hypothetical protein BLNAU_22624 [Blattamonas nauphoetae]|uniref:Uncharacterized protein n=1 Tax=Blattamonas nauphoetae TaxID=2049346 RepID=A0ABQ9WSI5_9EUKA|nr:hypothetical protein BLNAU_22624 [Blattamonas nauphoetae]
MFTSPKRTFDSVRSYFSSTLRILQISNVYRGVSSARGTLQMDQAMFGLLKVMLTISATTVDTEREFRPYTEPKERTERI